MKSITAMECVPSTYRLPFSSIIVELYITFSKKSREIKY